MGAIKFGSRKNLEALGLGALGASGIAMLSAAAFLAIGGCGGPGPGVPGQVEGTVQSVVRLDGSPGCPPVYGVELKIGKAPEVYAVRTAKADRGQFLGQTFWVAFTGGALYEKAEQYVGSSTPVRVSYVASPAGDEPAALGLGPDPCGSSRSMTSFEVLDSPKE